MKNTTDMNILLHRLFLVFAVGYAAACMAGDTLSSVSDLRTNGAFGFPQKDATVIYDQPLLRFSTWNNDQYLFAQTVLWTDDDASLGQTDDKREIGDYSELLLDLDADGKPTPQIDRNYLLNPWPGLGGMHYQICLGPGSKTGIKDDSKGRGAIRYVDFSGGRKVRVDTYLIPMSEISRKTGDKIRLCYWGFSPKPALIVNSAGYERGGKRYYGHNIPLSQYQDYTLAAGGNLEVAQIPDGRNDISPPDRDKVKMPEAGQAAPEISAKDWINLKSPPTLAGLRGKVVLVEFWATWCGPCVAGIPHLNDVYRRYTGANFQLLSFVQEGHETMDKFLIRQRVDYPIGLESGSLDQYGIDEIPHAFVIDRGGKIIWHGNSASSELDKIISDALEH